MPSLNVPVAPNCFLWPNVIVGLGGLIAIAVKVASVTVNDATPICPPRVAVTVEVPGELPDATPKEPDATLMVATDGFDEVQLDELVTSWVDPSARVAIAVNLVEVFSAKLGVAGEMAIAVKPSTVKFAVPLTPLSVQVIVAGPFAMAVTIFSLTVATFVADDDQAQTVARG